MKNKRPTPKTERGKGEAERGKGEAERGNGEAERGLSEGERGRARKKAKPAPSASASKLGKTCGKSLKSAKNMTLAKTHIFS